MATYMSSVMNLLSSQRNVFLRGGNGFTVEAKRYVRGLKRRPVKVLFQEKEAEKIPKTPPSAAVQKEKEVKVTSRAQHQRAESDFLKTTSIKFPYVDASKDQIDGLRFERAFPGDKRLAKVVSVARSRTFREHQGKILLEGRRLICDALNAGANPQMVFFSTADRLRELPLAKLKRATLVKVKFEDIKTWSDLVTPQGVIAIFARPDPSRLNFIDKGHSVPLSLICDNVRDPGNLGTILRCAAAAGCHNVLLTKGCVDAWEPKVLRAAMGAHFRLPIYSSLNWDDVKTHLPKPVTVYVADSSSSSSSSSVPPESEERSDMQVNSPHRPSKAGDYGWVSSKPNHKKMRYDEYESDSDSDCEDVRLSLPRVGTRLYHENWARGPTALVIGGETHGLTLEAVQLAEETAGQRLFIPIVPHVDSLNSAMAASILLFEGRKQLLKVMQNATGNQKVESPFS